MSDGSPVTNERTPRAFELTHEAIKHGKRTITEAGEPGVLGLRVGVKGGGCAGYSYVFDFAKKIRDGRDIVYDFDGLSVVVDDRSVELLRGATLDWEQRLMGYGFKWKNPNAKDDCGCGVSFST